ncbi:transcription factor Adf-1-like [Anticarsia gemmatalis]|uniref:transcription factor Adf-1-like n=1 Tax=Anticarsia gemmatalis TaxID=129554 RepID=UPI003F76F0BE
MAMDVERLIQCVKSHAYLYDLGHKDYKNTSRKAAVWEEIADELNENSETVKLKWKTVRDGYIKFKKQQKEGTSKKAVSNYIWSAQLKFLDNHQVSRKSKTPNAIALALDGVADNGAVDNAIVDNSVIDNTVVALQLSGDESTPSQSYSPTSILIPSPSDSGPFRNEHPPRRKRRIVKDDSDKTLSYLKNKKAKSYDATDHLFLSYSETFKTFSLRQQALLKVELAKLFSNAELNALQNAENLQESLVAGSSPGYAMGKAECEDGSVLTGADIHTVEDDDSDDDDVEFVTPAHTRRRRRKRNGSD